MRRVALLALLAGLASATAATAAVQPPGTGLIPVTGAKVPIYQSGTSIGEGVPVKAYATLTPTVELFGQPVKAQLAVVADTKYVDPLRLSVYPLFKPYRSVGLPAITRLHVGRFAQVTWTWTLRCLTSQCVPRIPPSDRVHVFQFHPVRIFYLAKVRKQSFTFTSAWPSLEVYSQINVATAQAVLGSNQLRWSFHPAPVAAPTYRISPSSLFWLVLGVGLGFFALALYFARRWYLILRPPVAVAVDDGASTALERALAVLAWAHEHGDETLQRKAFERVAAELGIETPVPEIDELTRTARELAWSPRTPDDEEVDAFAEQARQKADT